GAQHADRVLPGQLGQVGRGPAAVEQLGEQVGVAGDVVQPVGGEGGAVVVAADAEVVDAGDLAHVVEVVGDRGDGGDRAGVGLLEGAVHLHRLGGGVEVVEAVGPHVLVGGGRPV